LQSVECGLERVDEVGWIEMASGWEISGDVNLGLFPEFPINRSQLIYSV